MKTPQQLSRKHFLQRSLLAAGAATLVPAPTWAQQQPEKPAPLKLEWVKEFVGAAHGKIDRVKEMLASDAQLLHVSYDWGGGDYESAIEAAGHVGNKEIAAFLLGQGARYHVYLACMLGHLDTVKNILNFQPGLLNSKGPHGFTMLHHAQRGGAEAKPVEEYLLSLGAKETRIDFYAKR
jgi:hypothetical protein